MLTLRKLRSRHLLIVAALACALARVSPSTAATLQYFQATGQAHILPGDSDSSKVLVYVLQSDGKFAADATRSSVFHEAGSQFFTNHPGEISEADFSFQGATSAISLGQLFPSPLASIDALAASFTRRTYVPSLGGGEHSIKLEFIDLDGNVWDEPAPLPPVVLPPGGGSVGPVPPVVVLPPTLPELPPLVETPPATPPAADPPLGDIDVGPGADPSQPVDPVAIPDVILRPDIISLPYLPGRWNLGDWQIFRPFPYEPVFIDTIDDAPAHADEPLSLDASVSPAEMKLLFAQFTTADQLAALDGALLAMTRTAATAPFAIAGNVAATGPDSQLVIPEPTAGALAAAALAALLTRRRHSRRPG